jgi:ABC-2 type transport system permease protein
MNNQSHPMAESSIRTPETTGPALTAARTLYWSIRREIWENRSIYVAPIIAAALFLVGFAINLLAMRRHIGASLLIPAQQHDLFTSRFELSASLIMGTGLIVGVFYSLDALYGERRDRSILFWKSMPVSDFITVLSKLAIPLVILPLVGFVISLATQIIMLALSSVILMGSGVDIAATFTEASFFHISLVLLYHFVTVHGLWYLPLYGWLLMVSAWAPRAPFIWAFVPPFVVALVEKAALNSSHFLQLLQERLIGSGSAIESNHTGDFMATLIPHHFFTTPGLWTGVALGAIFLFVAVRLRRYRGPI